MYSIQNSAHTVEIRGIYILLYNQQVITVQYCTSAMTSKHSYGLCKVYEGRSESFGNEKLNEVRSTSM